MQTYTTHSYTQQLRDQCQTFATALLDHVRTSYELETLLNYSNDTDSIWEPGERQTLDRLELAIKYNQKDVSITYQTQHMVSLDF